jgi:glycosyltransferase involved in cell wall biosynthesis
MRISFLIHNVYGIGGTIRTTVNLAEALAERHEVEITSVFRHRDTPVFPIDPRVRVRPLVDLRPGVPDGDAGDPLLLVPAEDFPREDTRHRQYNALSDRRVRAWLGATRADVVVGTRPGLNVILAAHGPRRAVKVGQEHLTHDAHSPELRARLRASYPRLDALTTVTEEDAATYRSRMRLPGVRVQALPNSVPRPSLAPADSSAKVVVAAGRLAPVKRYDLLVEAFAQVVRLHPDWSLRIYGSGGQRERLRERTRELGLHNHVLLMGPANPMESEWVKGSIAACSSSLESFGMSIVEAMRCGLPVVSTACPCGPPEIIRDGVDGRLVEPGDVDAFAAALLDLVGNEPLRRRMGRQGLEAASRFDPQRIAARCETLFADLTAARRGNVVVRRLRRAGARAVLCVRAASARQGVGR